jgi:hypothetical protein
VRTGGGTPNLGENAGIHWHMAIGHKVYFKSTDPQLLQIPWIKVIRSDGSESIYRDNQSNLLEEALNKLPVNFMDCMDCHNRPSHVFYPPETAVDEAMAGGNISSKLPWIKKIALDALAKKYDDGQDVREAISQSIETYYGEKYPDVLKKQKTQIDQAIRTISVIYDRNVFPTMKVNWTTYPNNIGHRNWPGCFRCHNDHHTNEAGKVLTSSCPVCHTVPQRGPLMPLGATGPTHKEPWHPWPLKGKHARILCNLCHQAGYRPPLDCISCHRISASAPMMSSSCRACHLREQEVKPLVNCRSCHNTLRGLHRIKDHRVIPCTECHAPHTWSVTTREACLVCHGDKKTHYASTFCGECHQFRAN